MMKIKRFLYVVIPIISAIIVMTLVAEEFNRRSARSGQPPNISGTYLFKKENCSPSGCFFGADSKFTIGYLQYLPDYERVNIVQASSGITIKHAGWENRPMEMVLLQNDQSLGWDQNEFIYKWISWGAGLGIGRSSRELRLFLEDSRSLIIQTESNEIGLAFYFLPFTESMTYRMKLIRVDGSINKSIE